MELPLYMLEISDDLNDDAEVQFVSLVDRPAIQKNWNAFKNEQKFQIVSEDKHIISGCAMLADTPIFRSDANFGDYYVAFSKDTIVKIVQKYFKKGYQNNVNLMHDPNQIETGVTMFESFISDKTRGIHPMKGFEDAPDGSWFVSMLVENEDVWNQVKQGNVNGFSIEGIFNYSPKVSKEQQVMSEIYKILEGVELGGPGSGRQPEGGGDKESTGGGKTVSVEDEDVKDLVSKAQDAAPEVDKLGKDLAEKYGAVVTPINMKSADSIVRKTNTEENGNLGNIKDSVRNTIITDDPVAMQNIIKDLSNDPRVANGNGRIKTQTHESNPLGYSGNLINIKTSNGLTAEIQVNTPKMIYAKEKPENAKLILGEKKYNEIKKQVGIEGGKGHELYEKYRGLVVGKDDKQRKQIEKESKKYYSNFL
jgi:hypothetical protein